MTTNKRRNLKSADLSYAHAAINVAQVGGRGAEGEYCKYAAPPIPDIPWNVIIVPVDAQQESVLSFPHGGFADVSDGWNGFSSTNLLVCEN
jgi:hypothetical protein